MLLRLCLVSGFYLIIVSLVFIHIVEKGDGSIKLEMKPNLIILSFFAIQSHNH